MHWYENTARILKEKGISNAAIGRRLGISGQAVQMKLAGKRPTFLPEARVFAEFAGMSVSEMLGEEAYLIETRDEMELMDLFRLLTDIQQTQLLNYARFLAAQPKDQT